jgi:hypothetical protein
LERRRVEESRRFFRLSFVVGFAAFDDSHLDLTGLVVGGTPC